jgi:hypothetical protein
MLKNKIVAKVPAEVRDGHDEVMTSEQIRALPSNVVFGVMTVLERPEPIRKRRAAAKRKQR